MNSDGTRNSNANVPTIMPPITPVASERLPLAPTPWAIISGIRPNTIDKTVIRIGRRRTFAALYAACANVMPSDRRLPSYSVSRMAVLASSQIIIISPVCI